MAGLVNHGYWYYNHADHFGIDVLLCSCSPDRGEEHEEHQAELREQVPIVVFICGFRLRDPE